MLQSDGMSKSEKRRSEGRLKCVWIEDDEVVCHTYHMAPACALHRSTRKVASAMEEEGELVKESVGLHVHCVDYAFVWLSACDDGQGVLSTA